jgi:hypothetical protein
VQVVYLEAWAVECLRCHAKRLLAPDEKWLHAKDAPVAEMPRKVCGGCGLPLLFRWRDVEIEEAEVMA